MTDFYIITGASRGLGAALAEQLRNRPETSLVTLARRGTDIKADLGTEDGLRRACDSIVRAVAERVFDKAVLVNNAGVVDPVGPMDDLDAEAVARNVAVNLTAPIVLTQAFLRATATSRLRRVINISSGAARRPIPGWGAYCATKAALDMATRTLALESQQRGVAIQAVSLAPGVIDTDMQGVVRGVDAERFPDVERFRQMKAEGVLRPAADVARDILELEASGVLFGEPVADLRQLKPG